jgi:predicted NAD/FAD-binding protein
MNMLQSLAPPETVFCVTLNDNGRIHPENVVRNFRYSHPVFGINRKAMQGRHAELIGHQRISYCGAYWGNGFHEDGVKSGLAVAKSLEMEHQEAAV